VLDEIIVISPELNPGRGGLSDYTLRLAEEWAGRADVRFIIPESLGHRAAALREKLPASGGKVLLQYSAYGFDRLGYPRWLLRALTDWRKTSGGLLVLMFHEIWTFWPVLNKNYLVQKFHRSEIRKLVSVADVIFTSTPSQAEHLREFTSAVQVLPVGSNIRRTARTDDARHAGLAVLFGLQRSRIKALREMQTELKSLAAAGLIKKVTSFGEGKTTEGEQEERGLLSELRLQEGFEQAGALPEAEVSGLLGRASFGLSAQDELSFNKSGTFMAYAAHELNILSLYADVVGPEPLCWLTHPGELWRGLTTDELKSRAQNLRSWQEGTSSWPQIAERFAEGLQLGATSPAGRAGVGSE